MVEPGKDDFPEKKERDEKNVQNKWMYPIASLIILVVLFLVSYVTIETKEIPLTIVGPLLAAALFALMNYTITDWRSGKDK